MVVLSRSEELTPKDLPDKYRVEGFRDVLEIPSGTSLRSAEKKVVLHTLRQQEGNRSRTAEVLGIGRRTLIRKLQEYGVKDEKES